jgi:hypothetical protein
VVVAASVDAGSMGAAIDAGPKPKSITLKPAITDRRNPVATR